jgi:hypothetical protein
LPQSNLADIFDVEKARLAPGFFVRVITSSIAVMWNNLPRAELRFLQCHETTLRMTVEIRAVCRRVFHPRTVSK